MLLPWCCPLLCFIVWERDMSWLISGHGCSTCFRHIQSFVLIVKSFPFLCKLLTPRLQFYASMSTPSTHFSDILNASKALHDRGALDEVDIKHIMEQQSCMTREEQFLEPIQHSVIWLTLLHCDEGFFSWGGLERKCGKARSLRLGSDFIITCCTKAIIKCVATFSKF